MPIISLHLTINAPIEIVFDLARSIDLHKISTAHTNEQAIAGRTSGLICLGESVTWKAKHFGLYQTLSVQITEFTAPRQFTDEMVHRAFQRFRHEHRFDKTGPDTTMMTDVFDYTSPLGALGKVADWLFLKRYMRQLLATRNQIIKSFAESEQWRSVLTDRY